MSTTAMSMSARGAPAASGDTAPDSTSTSVAMSGTLPPLSNAAPIRLPRLPRMVAAAMPCAGRSPRSRCRDPRSAGCARRPRVPPGSPCGQRDRTKQGKIGLGVRLDADRDVRQRPGARRRRVPRKWFHAASCGRRAACRPPRSRRRGNARRARRRASRTSRWRFPPVSVRAGARRAEIGDVRRIGRRVRHHVSKRPEHRVGEDQRAAGEAGRDQLAGQRLVQASGPVRARCPARRSCPRGSRSARDRPGRAGAGAHQRPTA